MEFNKYIENAIKVNVKLLNEKLIAIVKEKGGCIKYVWSCSEDRIFK